MKEGIYNDGLLKFLLTLELENFEGSTVFRTNSLNYSEKKKKNKHDYCNAPQNANDKIYEKFRRRT